MRKTRKQYRGKNKYVEHIFPKVKVDWSELSPVATGRFVAIVKYNHLPLNVNFKPRYIQILNC